MILEQDAVAAMVFVRKGGNLVVEALTTGDTIEMPETDVRVPLAAFHADMELVDEAAAQVS